MRPTTRAEDAPEPASSTPPRGPAGASALAAAHAQFDAAADHLALDPGMRLILRSPQREWTVNFPVTRDSGEVELFTGYRVQHNVARGPAKGGLRFHPQTDLDDVARAGHVDDLEMRPRGRALRRRQGRRHVRPAHAERPRAARR